MWSDECSDNRCYAFATVVTTSINRLTYEKKPAHLSDQNEIFLNNFQNFYIIVYSCRVYP